MKLLTTEEIAQLLPPEKLPKTKEIADACINGACNVYALIRSLDKAAIEFGAAGPFSQVREHPAIAVIIGQISYLIGESLGPTSEALQNYEKWSTQK